jgi:hypothetical protein
MKAIQIFDVNRELLETWGESEELTWGNSFGELVGSALVVDDKFPQGYSVMSASHFVSQYVWESNFGTYGWSEIKRVSDVDTEPELKPEECIYIVWDMNADSWTGSRTMQSIHKTLDGAIQAIPERIRKETNKRDLYEPYVANYTYLAVEKRILED